MLNYSNINSIFQQLNVVEILHIIIKIGKNYCGIYSIPDFYLGLILKLTS